RGRVGVLHAQEIRLARNQAWRAGGGCEGAAAGRRAGEQGNIRRRGVGAGGQEALVEEEVEGGAGREELIRSECCPSRHAYGVVLDLARSQGIGLGGT